MKPVEEIRLYRLQHLHESVDLFSGEMNDIECAIIHCYDTLYFGIAEQHTVATANEEQDAITFFLLSQCSNTLRDIAGKDLVLLNRNAISRGFLAYRLQKIFGLLNMFQTRPLRPPCFRYMDQGQ